MKNRKVRFVRPGVVELQALEESFPALGPTEVRVRNQFSLVSAGTELACLSGLESWFQLPGTPGYIAVGEVLEAGSACGHLRQGQKVFTYGPHAEFFTIDTTNRWGGVCIPVPEQLPLDQACFTRMASIAFTSVRKSSIELGDRVLVTGLGQVGNFAAQLATLQGATVIGVDLSARRRATALECGIAHVVDASASDWKQQVLNLAGTRGLTTHIEASGVASVAAEASSLLGMHGESILLGSPRAPHQANLTDYLQRIHLPPFVEVKGSLEWTFPTFPTEFSKHSVVRNSEILMELIASGRLKVAPLYTHRLSPASAPEAYAGLRERKDDYVGVVFDWSL
jgi:2-desacetyl-2-hydroxyethyl bacteriochlorophyllide A dehydrogenase